MDLLKASTQGWKKDADLEKRLAGLADAGPQAIADRIAQLDREWSAGRATKWCYLASPNA